MDSKSRLSKIAIKKAPTELSIFNKVMVKFGVKTVGEAMVLGRHAAREIT